MMRAPFGIVASIRARSSAIAVSAVLLRDRSPGLISFRRIRQSGGMRFTYSPKPLSIHAGILWPTAAMTSCMLCDYSVDLAFGLAGARLTAAAFLAGAFLAGVFL